MDQHKLRDGVGVRERVGGALYEAARRALAGGLLQSVLCVLVLRAAAGATGGWGGTRRGVRRRTKGCSLNQRAA